MAAGEGFKEWQTGDVLTANDVNGYLNQGIWVFDDAADRTAQVTSPQEGNFAYLRDDNKLYYYTGSAWAEADTSGIQPSEFAAKGDLLAGTGASTFDNLAVGTNGHVLTADSTETTGMKWAAPAGGGKVLQVVAANTTTATSNSTTTFADTTLTATITPSSTNSKILVLVNQNGLLRSAGNAESALAINLLRGATVISQITDTSLYTGTALLLTVPSAVAHYLDSPATTSATTYKTQFKNRQGAAEVIVQHQSNMSSIVLLEIGA